MSCNITAGRLRVCKDSLGGNSTLYLYNPISDGTPAWTVAGGEATAMNVLLTAAYKFELEGDGNTLEEAVVSDRSTGTRVNTQTLTIVLKKPDADTNAEFNLLASNYAEAVIVDRNGNYRAIGIDDGIDFNITSSTGGAKTDLNGYTLTGVSTTSELAPFLDEATQSAFLAVAV